MLKWFAERIFACIGFYAAAAQLAGNDNSSTSNIIMFVMLSVMVVYIWHEIKEWVQNKPLIYKGDDVSRQKQKINQFMLKWIQQGQKIAIFSNDMSWAKDDAEIKEVLFRKAKDHEVELFLPKENDLSAELKQAGATVYAYDSGFEPLIRFTVINRGRDDARVAIGRRINEAGDFQVKRYSIGHDPTCALAIDILKVIQRRLETQNSGPY